MKLRSRLLPLVAAVALVGAACAADDTSPDEPDDGVEDATSTDDADLDEGTTEDDADLDDGTTEDDATEGEASAGASTSAASGTVTAGLEVATADLGDHIVTAEGATTYAAVDQREGEVICVADCAQVWAPVIADGDIDVDDGIEVDLVTTITLDDGREQVAIDGAPLHTFVSDAAAGDARGQGSADRWYVVAPDGSLVGAADDGGGED